MSKYALYSGIIKKSQKKKVEKPVVTSAEYGGLPSKTEISRYKKEKSEEITQNI